MCNQQQSHRQLQSHNSFSTSRGRFLPLLCRLSIKDVKLPKWPEYSNRSPSSSSSSSSASSSSSNDPTSPKVSCIGQVKKRKNNNNKFISCPIQHKSADSNLRYAKLRKLFSGKNLLTNGVVNTTVETNTTHSCKMMIRNGTSTTSTTGARLIRMPPPAPPQRKMRSCRSDDHEIVNILELDPPLPVVKKVQQCGRDDQVNLWKRRCGTGGAGNGKISLRSLQIEQIHVPNNHHIPPTTV